MDYLVIVTTCPNRQCADVLADYLVRERLAACVNQIAGIRSVYEWEGRITSEEEFLLLIKTRTEMYDRVEEAIRSRHPYQVPEVIALPVERGSEEYLSWINRAVENKQ